MVFTTWIYEWITWNPVSRWRLPGPNVVQKEWMYNSIPVTDIEQESVCPENFCPRLQPSPTTTYNKLNKRHLSLNDWLKLASKRSAYQHPADDKCQIIKVLITTIDLYWTLALNTNTLKHDSPFLNIKKLSRRSSNFDQKWGILNNDNVGNFWIHTTPTLSTKLLKL